MLNKNSYIYIISVSIIILVALTIIITQKVNQQKLQYSLADIPELQNTSLNNLIPVNANDHIRGGRQAKLKIITYSDLECPFCASFHPVMQQVIQQYGNQVQWVYRHLPLYEHPAAQSAAIATECVADLGGNAKFWQFLDVLFANQKSLSSALYQQLAAELNIDQQKFYECLSSDKFIAKINAHRQNAFESGGKGTPFVIIETSNGTRESFSGLASFEEMSQIINSLIK